MGDPIAVVVPQETVNDDSVKVVSLSVKDGDRVVADQLLAELETSKAVLELRAPSAGLVRLVSKLGQEVPIGQPVCYIVESADSVIPVSGMAAPAPAARGATASAPVSAAPGRAAAAAVTNTAIDDTPALRFSPVAKKMADEAGLTLADFSGVRIVRSADVRARIDGLPLPGTAPKSAPSAPQGARTARVEPKTADLVLATGVAVRWEDLPRRKIVEAKQIGAGMSRVLPSAVTVQVPTAGLKAAVALASDERVTASTVVLYETARLLRKYPMFNAVHDGERVAVYESVNVGVAIDDGSGLMVPVVRDADRKSLAELSAETRSMLERYIERSLAVADFVGTTFTVSDLSSQSVFHFLPLISQGQSAILGVGAETYAPGASQGMLTLTLAFDHHLADGRLAAAFLNDLGSRIAAYEAAGPQDQSASTYCASCNRDAETVRSLKGFLLRSAEPEGLVCSFCLGGF